MNESPTPSAPIQTWWNEIEPFQRQYFECDCHSDEHTLSFSWDDEENLLYTSVYLNQYRSFLRRIWVAVKYVFGYKSRYGDWDCFLLRREDAKRLEALLKKLG